MNKNNYANEGKIFRRQNTEKKNLDHQFFFFRFTVLPFSEGKSKR